MNKTAIIIPSRLSAVRLPNKPLELINNKEMILHVYDAALKSNVGEVIIATPDQKIIDVVNKVGGRAVLTKNNHQTGTDRIFEVFKNLLKSEPDIIINLQGDMPNINPKVISELANYMKQNDCDIATLASDIKSEKEKADPNVVKVVVKNELNDTSYVNALDFLERLKLKVNYMYHHVGIYGFTSKSLIKYVSLKRSRLEIERKLEQLRALENGMKVHVGYIKFSPLSVDTKEDLNEVKKLMSK